MRLLILSFVIAVSLSAQSTPSCSEEVLFRFFPREFVAPALEEQGLTKEKADEAANVLVNKDRDVIDLIETKASKMSPNPLKEHGNPSARAELFKGAITEVFTDVAATYELKDKVKVNKALQSVQENRIKRFEECKSRGLLPKQ